MHDADGLEQAMLHEHWAELLSGVVGGTSDTLDKAKALVGKGKPIAIMMHTIMSKGVDFMENDHNWHGVAPNDEQLAKALAQLPETLGDY